MPFLCHGSLHLPITISLTIVFKDSTKYQRKRPSILPTSLSEFPSSLPLIVGIFFQPQDFAHLPHRKFGAISINGFILHSGACIKMCRDFFRISTFILSSANSLLTRLFSRSRSLIFIFTS